MEEKKSCFIITPIGRKESSTFRQTEGLIESVLEPVLDKNGYDVEVAHRISESGSINNQIIKRIESSDLVIANLTELNPNVFYELGLRHAIGKHVISIAENGTNLPFDINDQRTIFFENDIAGTSELMKDLNKAILNINYSEDPDNPFYDTMRVTQIREKIRESKTEVEGESVSELIIDEITSLKRQFSNFVRNQNSRNNSIDSNRIGPQELKYFIWFDENLEAKNFLELEEFKTLDTYINNDLGLATRANLPKGESAILYSVRGRDKSILLKIKRLIERFFNDNNLSYEDLSE